MRCKNKNKNKNEWKKTQNETKKFKVHLTRRKCVYVCPSERTAWFRVLMEREKKKKLQQQQNKLLKYMKRNSQPDLACLHVNKFIGPE